MSPEDEVERRFRERTGGLRPEPIRWERLPAPQRAFHSMPLRVLIAIIALTVLLAAAAILSKALVDPAYKRALTGDDVQAVVGRQELTSMTLREYFRKYGISTSPRPSRRRMNQPGLEVELTLRVRGIAAGRLVVTLTLHDARTRRPAAVSVPRYGGGMSRIARNQRALTLNTWTPRPRDAGRYFLRIRLGDTWKRTDAGGLAIVETLDSRPFRLAEVDD